MFTLSARILFSIPTIFPMFRSMSPSVSTQNFFGLLGGSIGDIWPCYVFGGRNTGPSLGLGPRGISSAQPEDAGGGGVATGGGGVATGVEGASGVLAVGLSVASNFLTFGGGHFTGDGFVPFLTILPVNTSSLVLSSPMETSGSSPKSFSVSLMCGELSVCCLRICWR